MTRFKRSVLSAVLFMALIQITGCKSQEIASSRRTGDIAIDGDYDDWEGNLTFIEKKNVSVGFLHDDEFFYVCLIANDSQLGREIMGRGLILWLDSESDKIGKIGIKYPLSMLGRGMFPVGMSQGGMPQGGMFPGGQGEENSGMGEGDRGQGKRGMPFLFALNEVEIQLPDGEEFERFIFSELTGTGFEVRSAMQNEKCVYEMKIPLHCDETHTYALGEGDIRSVNLEIETPEMEGMGSGGSPGGGEEGGGMGGPGMGGGGGMPPGGGRMPPGGGPPGSGSREVSQSQEFKASFTVTLAQ
jgi:hypothetical protein